MGYERKDHYFKKAKAEGKASRAAYKILELNEKFHFLRKGAVVVDLGCAPGSWLKELSEAVGPNGRVVGIDLRDLTISLPPNTMFVKGSIEDDVALAAIESQLPSKVDVVLSDMAPNTSGVAFADAYKSFELASIALGTCSRLLKKGGSFIVKIFEGKEVAEYQHMLRKAFSKIVRVVPKATRKTSGEMYFVCLDHRL
ncbi:MAG: RlmE family RNA methyltransferase [Deltaproteobacteria bacterium]|nr:RlmE family RNA methyltransferase [Deltaproteobacteria bacterium]